MKKVFAGMVIALLTVIFCFTLTGCDKSGNIKKAFEDEGYTVTSVDTNDDKTESLLVLCGLTNEQIEILGKHELIFCLKGLNSAIVIKFAAASEIKDFLTVEDSEGNKDTSAYDKAKENGSINGNCLIITLSSAAREIFKNA